MIDPLSLLGALGSTVRLASGGKPDTPLESLDFEALLSKARSGDIASSLPVAIDPALGIELSGEQLDRLAAAADRAQASGAQRAAVLIDGRAFELDVESRKITGIIDDRGGQVVVGLDALIRIDSEVDSGINAGTARDAQGSPSATPGQAQVGFRAPGLGFANPGVIEALRAS